MKIRSQTTAERSGLPEIEPERFLFRDTVPGGRTWSHIVKRGVTLRLTDLEGRANVSLIAYNAAFPTERYNMADTLKAQHTARLTRGNVLYSDMGRIFFSITGDSHGWHDTICGCSNAEQVKRQYGTGTFAEDGNDFLQNGRDAFLLELAKWNLGERDLMANVNFFSKVATSSVDSGVIGFDKGARVLGAQVDLRAEMEVLTIINTCPHPLDPATAYTPGPLQIELFKTDEPGPDDVCRTYCRENQRGFINTERYFL